MSGITSKKMKLGIIAAAVIAAPAVVAINPEPASAGCYGTGYARRCDGYGSNTYYSPRGSNGRTNYYRNGSNYKRQTYKTYYR